MNETSLDDLYELLLSIKNGKPKNEILLDDDTTKWAKLALQRMFEV
jgi:quinolinate synthase